MNNLKHPLTNAQVELMKLFATNLSESDLEDLKSLLAHFFAERALKSLTEFGMKEP